MSLKHTFVTYWAQTWITLYLMPHSRSSYCCWGNQMLMSASWSCAYSYCFDGLVGLDKLPSHWISSHGQLVISGIHWREWGLTHITLTLVITWHCVASHPLLYRSACSNGQTGECVWIVCSSTYCSHIISKMWISYW